MDAELALELLLAQRTRIERALIDLAGSPDRDRGHVNQTMADEGSELFEQERDAGLVDRLRGELAAVERAERRLSDGTFGISIESGMPIPDDRLRAMPWAERTVDEQRRLETGHG